MREFEDDPLKGLKCEYDEYNQEEHKIKQIFVRFSNWLDNNWLES